MKKAPLGVLATTFVPSLRERMRLLDAAEIDYKRPRGRSEIESIQLAAFNASWLQAVAVVPFYAHWKAKHNLPAEIADLRELAAFPIVDKGVIRENIDLVNRTPNVRGWISTGGSSGEPVRLPHGTAELSTRYVSNYVARAWSGVEPNDRYFHVWGHSHLFGSGAQRWKNMAIRRLKDYTLGVRRVPSYDQSLANASKNARLIQRTEPVYIVGATTSVVRIATAIQMFHQDWEPPSNLKSITVTAETASPADVELIESAFGVPCFVEYGSSETGVVAAYANDKPIYSVLWRENHLWASETNEIRVSSLTKRAFPLVNYSLDDKVYNADTEFTILRIESVAGRAHEIVELKVGDGEPVALNCTGIVQAVKAHSLATSVQMAPLPAGRILVGVTAFSVLDLAVLRSCVVKELRRSVRGISPENMEFVQLSTPLLSLAGKVRVLVDDSEALRSRAKSDPESP